MFDLGELTANVAQDLALGLPEAAAIVRTTVWLGRELGLRGVADGVETAEQRTALAELGCTAAQGYHFFNPMPADKIWAVLGSLLNTNPPAAPSGEETNRIGQMIEQLVEADGTNVEAHPDLSTSHERNGNAARTYRQLGGVAKQQRRFEDAERYYRDALEIYLGLNDQQRAAGMFHDLGAVAKQQRRFEDAERYYRDALEIYLGLNNQQRAANTFHQLGVLLSEFSRHHDAVNALLHAALSSYAVNSVWPLNTLNLLGQEMTRLPDKAFQQAITDIIPTSLRKELRDASLKAAGIESEE